MFDVYCCMLQAGWFAEAFCESQHGFLYVYFLFEAVILDVGVVLYVFVTADANPSLL